ncbi:MAG: hypothetical protein KAX99_00900 [Azonexus sp.]|nr:hypothetical protein [Azonexus sp.]MBP8168195.1 hypothetical protein [Azonexus sp.]
MKALYTTAPTAKTNFKYSTGEAAARLRAAPQTPRASLCRLGHWLGMVPVKLPNGRLLWDAAEVERLASGEVAK